MCFFSFSAVALLFCSSRMAWGRFVVAFFSSAEGNDCALMELTIRSTEPREGLLGLCVWKIV